MKLFSRAKYEEHLYEKSQPLDVIQIVQAIDAQRVNAGCLALVRHDLERIAVFGSQCLGRGNAEQIGILAKLEADEDKADQKGRDADNLDFL